MVIFIREIILFKLKNILFFTSFPPPNTGQTLATQLIFKVLKSIHFVKKINTVDSNRLSRDSGEFSIGFLLNLIHKFFLLFLYINFKTVDVYYTVYSSSRLGLIKDAIGVFLVKYFCFKRIDIIAHIHSGNFGLDFNSKFDKFFFDFVLSNTDKFIFLSRRLNNVSSSLRKDQSVYLSNMIGSEIICSDTEIKKKWGGKQLERSDFHIVYISNMILEKGYLDLFKATKILNSSNPVSINIHVHYVGAWGDPLKESQFKELISKLDGVDSIVYGPVYDRLKLKELFLLADVFVLPTYYKIEAQPLSIIEAFSSATPVISSNHAGIPDMVLEGCNGFLVEKENPSEIASALIELISNYSVWKEMSVCSRNTYLEKYSSEIISPQLLKIFTD